MSEWWVSRGSGSPVGPAPTDVLIRGVKTGRVPEDALVCRVGDQRWSRLSEIEELWDLIHPEESSTTNVIKRPWFLSSPSLPDVESGDEATRVFDPAAHQGPSAPVTETYDDETRILHSFSSSPPARGHVLRDASVDEATRLLQSLPDDPAPRPEAAARPPTAPIRLPAPAKSPPQQARPPRDRAPSHDDEATKILPSLADGAPPRGLTHKQPPLARPPEQTAPIPTTATSGAATSRAASPTATPIPQVRSLGIGIPTLGGSLASNNPPPAAAIIAKPPPPLRHTAADEPAQPIPTAAQPPSTISQGASHPKVPNNLQPTPARAAPATNLSPSAPQLHPPAVKPTVATRDLSVGTSPTRAQPPNHPSPAVAAGRIANQSPPSPGPVSTALDPSMRRPDNPSPDQDAGDDAITVLTTRGCPIPLPSAHAPADLMDEDDGTSSDDLPASPSNRPKYPTPRPAAGRPATTGSLTPRVSGSTASSASKATPHRSIDVRSTVKVQEATQPAVRAYRPPGTVQISVGTLIVGALALVLLVLFGVLLTR